MMDLSQVEHAILKTFAADRPLTRRQKRTLEKLVEEAGLDGEKRRALLGRLFATARGELGEIDDRWVFEWLEGVARLLIPDRVSQVEAFFTSADDDDLVGEICSWLGEAAKSVEICVFTITDNRLRDAVLAAHRRRVAVRVITDDRKATDEGADIATLLREGVAVRMDSSEHHMHHKFAIFDRRRVATGSYNWTRSAAKDNLENLVLSNDARLVEAYLGEFQRLWDLFSAPDTAILPANTSPRVPRDVR